MQKTLNELAVLLNGRVAGDGDALIRRVRGIEEAEEGDLTFVANPKYSKKMEGSSASAILVLPGMECPGKNLLIVDDPYVAFGRALALFHPEEAAFTGRSPHAFVEHNADVSEETTLYPGVYVGHRAKVERGVVLYPGVFVDHDAVIGEDSILYPNVTVYRRCRIGRRVILHAGVVVGSDGFGFARPGRENVKIPQIGIVQIDDDVEVGANTTIDRAAIGRTWIQRGVKIDNLVQIAHNCNIGAYSVLAGCTGIAGSVTLGEHCIVGGAGMISGHVTLAPGTTISGGSLVMKNITQPGLYTSVFPIDSHDEWVRNAAHIRRLSHLAERVSELEKKLKEINTND